MTPLRRRHGGRQTAFALLVVLLLSALLLVAAQALAVFAGTEGVRAAKSGSDLQHRLGAESLMLILPALRAELSAQRPSEDQSQVYTYAFGDCLVEAEITPGRSLRRIAPQGELETGRLIESARSAGIPAEDVVLRPIKPMEASPVPAKYLWFDQLVSPTQIGEVFRLERIAGARNAQPQSWSELVTFWGTASASAVPIRMTTRIEGALRRWFAACDLNRDRIVVHFLGAI